MLLEHYHELCNTNDPSSTFVSPPPIPNIESFSQSNISSLSMYWILPMQLVVDYSHQLGFYQMIHHQVIIWWIEKMVKYWEQEVEKQTLMKGHSCYTTRDNAQVTLQHVIFAVLVSTQTHQPCIHIYFYFHSWWTAVAWYLQIR